MNGSSNVKNFSFEMWAFFFSNFEPVTTLFLCLKEGESFSTDKTKLSISVSSLHLPGARTVALPRESTYLVGHLVG